jgi:hypothetical protein
MSRLLLAAAVAVPLACAAPARAQDTRALAQQYVEMPEVQVMFDEMISPEMLAEQFRFGLPPDFEISDDQLDRIGDVMADMMTSLRPDMTAMMVDGLDEAFTAAELSALIAFYSSPEGASVMRKMTPFLQQFMAEFAPLVAQRQQEFLPALIEILEE